MVFALSEVRFFFGIKRVNISPPITWTTRAFYLRMSSNKQQISSKLFEQVRIKGIETSNLFVHGKIQGKATV